MKIGKVTRCTKQMTIEQKEMMFKLIAEFGFLGLIRELCNYTSVKASTATRDRHHWTIASEAMNEVYEHTETLLKRWESVEVNK